MRKWCVVFLAAWCASGWADGRDKSAPPGNAERQFAELPATATGTFVQRKTLADVGVTITSTGTFRFEKGRLFEWCTLKPLPSTFTATPTNYAVTVNGKTTTRSLRSNVDEIAKVFEIKEVKDFVKGVKSEPEGGFPNKVTVEFKNGDRLDIEMKR